MSTWIEGDGTVRTVFRKLVLWDYTSLESCKLQLVNAIEKKNTTPSPYLLDYAIIRRKGEIRWVSVVLPIIIMSIPLPFLFYGAFLSHQVQHLRGCIAATLVIALLFRFTYYSQYLAVLRLIYSAGDAIQQELTVAKSRKEVELPKEVESTELVAFVAQPVPVEMPAEVVTIPLAVAEAAESFQPIPIPEDKQPEDLLIPPQPAGEKPVFEEAAGIPNKGSINSFLLHELIKSECGRPNIYKGDIHKNVRYYSYITGCKPKNILDKAKYYKDRGLLNLATLNSRTTHRKYLEMLLQHYQEIGDDTLYQKAEDLQAFIENINKGKKV